MASQAQIRAKAEDIRRALIDAKVIFSPDPTMKFDDLPPKRQQRWIALTEYYAEIFG